MEDATRNDQALAYFKTALANGRSLAQQLARLDLSEGVIASLPADALTAGFSLHSGGLRDAGLSFKLGNLQFVRIDNAQVKQALIRLLTDHLSSFEDAVVFLEHSLARAGDAWLARSQLRYVTHDDDVIFLVTDSASVEEAVNAVPFRDLVAAITRGASVAGSGSETLTIDLKEWAHNSTQIIVGAFDGEGALVWSRQVTEPPPPRP